MFSIIIPTFNNLNYVKILLSSLKKNSAQDHEIIFHVNEGSDGTLDYLNKNNLKYTFSKSNVGLCTATNLAASKSSSKYILYSHDDMYFCPGWDTVLENEIIGIGIELGRLLGRKEYSAGFNSMSNPSQRK